MSKRRPRYELWIAPLILVLLLLAEGCSEDQKRVEDPPVRVLVVHEPELGPFLRERLRAFEAREQPKTLSHATQLELVPERGANAAQQISRGALKVHAWISSSSSLIEHANECHHEDLRQRVADLAGLDIHQIAGATLERITEEGARLSWVGIDGGHTLHLHFSHRATDLASLSRLLREQLAGPHGRDT